MSTGSGAHVHDTSGAHIQDQLFYFLPHRAYSVLVIFVYHGKDLFDLFFINSATAPAAVLTTDSVMLFKVPLGFDATFRITEVATAPLPGYQGRYVVDMQLHPYRGAPEETETRKAAVAGQIRELKEIAAKESTNTDVIGEIGQCVSGNPECPGSYSPCTWGQSVTKVDEVCACRFPQGGGGGKY